MTRSAPQAAGRPVEEELSYPERTCQDWRFHRASWVPIYIVQVVLGEAGYKEVTLLGQNIDAYGRDLPGMSEDGSGRRANTFTDLLDVVHDVPGIERIRFATSHPR